MVPKTFEPLSLTVHVGYSVSTMAISPYHFTSTFKPKCLEMDIKQQESNMYKIIYCSVYLIHISLETPKMGN